LILEFFGTARCAAISAARSLGAFAYRLRGGNVRVPSDRPGRRTADVVVRSGGGAFVGSQKKRRPERFRGLRSRCALSAHVELFVLEGATPVPDRGRNFLHGPLWPYFFFAAGFLAGAFL